MSILWEQRFVAAHAVDVQLLSASHHVSVPFSTTSDFYPPEAPCQLHSLSFDPRAGHIAAYQTSSSPLKHAEVSLLACHQIQQQQYIRLYISTFWWIVSLPPTGPLTPVVCECQFLKICLSVFIFSKTTHRNSMFNHYLPHLSSFSRDVFPSNSYISCCVRRSRGRVC